MERTSDLNYQTVPLWQWAKMRELRQERAGIERQLTDATTALDADREVFKLGLDILTQLRRGSDHLSAFRPDM